LKNKEKMENQPQSKTEYAIAAYNSLWKEQNEIYSAAARSFGLSDSAMWILYFLRLNNGTCQQKELASSLSQPKQTTNSAVKQLERGGYVTLKCGSDRRCRLVELTPKGSGLAVSTSDHVIAAERETWGDFTEEEQDSLIELLSKYNKRLKTRMEEKNEK
jgi:DNA-binding MarR family transcriptional regulator